MRFNHLKIDDLIIDDDQAGSFVVSATDELIDIVNTIRSEIGMTDLVNADIDNDVYYSFYLSYSNEKIRFFSSVAHGEKDDFSEYDIELSEEEIEKFKWMIIKKLTKEIING